MKRILCIFLCILLTASLTACSYDSSKDFPFYYCNSERQFGSPEGVIGSELRDIAGHERDAAYIITLYLAGPLDEDLISPFHRSTRLQSVEQKDGEMIIKLTDSGVYVLDSEFSLACACLSMTCMELSGVTRVTIENHDRTITMTRDNITFFDIAAETSAAEDSK